MKGYPASCHVPEPSTASLLGFNSKLHRKRIGKLPSPPELLRLGFIFVHAHFELLERYESRARPRGSSKPPAINERNSQNGRVGRRGYLIRARAAAANKFSPIPSSSGWVPLSTSQKFPLASCAISIALPCPGCKHSSESNTTPRRLPLCRVQLPPRLSQKDQ